VALSHYASYSDCVGAWMTSSFAFWIWIDHYNFAMLLLLSLDAWSQISKPVGCQGRRLWLPPVLRCQPSCKPWDISKVQTPSEKNTQFKLALGLTLNSVKQWQSLQPPLLRLKIATKSPLIYYMILWEHYYFFLFCQPTEQMHQGNIWTILPQRTLFCLSFLSTDRANAPGQYMNNSASKLKC
jgi:hypothetical protein